MNTNQLGNKIGLSVLLMVHFAVYWGSRAVPQPMGPILHHYQALPSQGQDSMFAQAILQLPSSPFLQPDKVAPKGGPPLQHIPSSPQFGTISRFALVLPSPHPA